MITVIRFTASWCMPCKAVAPIFDKLQTDFGSRANFLVVDVDKSPDLAKKYDVTSVPTILFVSKSGEILSRLVGVKTKNEYEKLLNSFI